LIDYFIYINNVNAVKMKKYRHVKLIKIINKIYYSVNSELIKI